jgi:hypothetical protein
MITTVADLFSRYSDLCGEMGPAMTRDELRADFQEWCAAHDVAARYETSWEAYLDAADGPFTPTVIQVIREQAEVPDEREHERAAAVELASKS